jgi:tetratricopeptide (TPR) repeat protein
VGVGDDEGALEHWGPVLDGTHTCSEEPHHVLSNALLPLLRLGRTDEARGAFLRGYPLVKGNVNLRGPVARHIEFCALSGNEARGLEILAEHSAWLTDTEIDVIKRMDFVEGVTVLLRRLDALGHGDLTVSGGFTVASLLASYEAEIKELCSRYDTRNGNTEVTERVTQRLGTHPLAEHLPLGLPSRLPSASAGAAATGLAGFDAAAYAAGQGAAGQAAAGKTGLDGLIARAMELEAAFHPGTEKAWLRVAAAESAGLELPSDVALQVAEAKASGTLRTDPASARAALLVVADDYAAAGDLAASFRVRATASRALSLTDAAAARAEAAELKVSAVIAFEAGLLPLRQYLAMRGSEHIIAVTLLGNAESRDRADVDAAAVALGETLAEAQRRGEAHTAGRCHEMLGQLDFWRDDFAGAVGHSRAARADYMSAGEPWYAAAPSMTIAQFAIREGDHAEAGEHARFALANAYDLEPQGRAMLSSILVESLLAQQGRHLEVADAALTAAARWDGISEPDTLHNTFHAARAYAALGRHAEACALFAQAMPKVAVPYQGAAIAMTHEAYGRSLKATDQHKEAAAQFLAAAQIVADDPGNARAHASLASAAAQSLQRAGELGAALTAFRRAAELFGALGDTVSLVRARRSVAWLQHWTWTPEDPGAAPEALAAADPGVATMRAVLADQERQTAADHAPELAEELENTHSQLQSMLADLSEEKEDDTEDGE